jgi:acyl carrier protein
VPFGERFPDYFLTYRYSINITHMLVEDLYKLVSDVLRIAPEKITRDLHIHEVDSWNSLTHIELVLAIEEKFNIQLSEDEIVAITSIGEMIRILTDRGALARTDLQER